MSNEEDKHIMPEHDVNSKKSISRIIFLLIGFLLLVGTIGYIGYVQYFNSMEASSQEKQKLQQMQTSVIALENIAQSQKALLKTLTEDLNQLKQNITTTSQTPQLQDNTLIAEVRYLVKLADINLQFRQSVSQALTMLKLADDYLRTANNSKFAEMRKALAADIVDLQSTPMVDTAGIYMRLLALNGKVDELPLLNKPMPVTSNSQAMPPADENLPWWKKGLKNSFESLRSLVVVRYNQTGKLPLVPPDQQGYLYQNWHTVLLNAMTALMQGQSTVYQANLKQALTWIKEYSMVDTPVAQGFIAELNQLQAVDINPTLPKITRSLEAIENVPVA